MTSSPCPRSETRTSQTLTPNIMDIWGKTKSRITHVRDRSVRSKLEFILYQEHLSLTEVRAVYALVQYLLAKQAYEDNVDEKLDALTMKFAKSVMREAGARRGSR